MDRYSSQVPIYLGGDPYGPAFDDDIPAYQGALWVDLTGTSPVLKICTSSDGSSYTWEPVAQSPVMDTRTAVTSAQLLTLNTTPVTILPAPGAGLYTIPLHIDFYFKYGTVAYTAANPSTANIFHAASAGIDNIITTDLYTLIHWNRDAMRTQSGLNVTYNAVGQVPAQLENQPIEMQLAAGIAAPTLGDGVLYVNCVYMTVSVP